MSNFVSNEFYDDLVVSVSNARESVIIFSAFVKIQALETLGENISDASIF